MLSPEFILGLISNVILISGALLAWREFKARKPVLAAQAADALTQASLQVSEASQLALVRLERRIEEQQRDLVKFERERIERDRAHDAEIQALKTDLEEEREKRRELQQELEAERKRNNKLSDDLTRLKDEHEQLKKNYRDVVEENRVLRERVTTLEQEKQGSGKPDQGGTAKAA